MTGVICKSGRVLGGSLKSWDGYQISRVGSPDGANLSPLITLSTSIGGHLRSVSTGFEQQPNGETLQPLARRNLSARAG